MAYSHSRLRKMLALVRIFTGTVFVSVGLFKVTSLEFGKVLFPSFLDQAIDGGAVDWFRPVLEWMVSVGPARIGVTIGFIELFVGIAMVLGLAVRPASLVGMMYSVCLLLATWNPQGAASMFQTADHQFRSLFPLFVLFLLGVGHAGETWGVGALYHRHRARRWERENLPLPQEEIPAEEEQEAEPSSFAEFVEREEAEPDREHAWSSLDETSR